MSKRVYEVARSLGLKGSDLAGKINALGLGFSVNNHMSSLTEDQEDMLRRALEREARENMVEERIRATVIRRKPRRKKVAPAEPELPVTGPPPVSEVGPSPVVRRRKVEPEPAPEPVPVNEAAVEPERPTAPVASSPAVEPEAAPAEAAAVEAEPLQPVEPAPAVAEAVSVEEAAPEGQAEPEPAVVGEVAVEPSLVEQAAAEPQPELEVEPEPIEVPEEAFEVYEAPAGVESSHRPADAEIVAALARRQSADASRRGARGAQVTGMLSPELLKERLAADNKTFGPPPKGGVKVPTGTRETFELDQANRRKRKRTGKKVYGQSELYDRRSSRRRAQRKTTGGQGTQITTASEHKRVIKMEDAILVSDLAHQMGVKAGEIALKLMMDLGVKGANINTPLDLDAASLLADQYDYTVEQVGFDLKRYLPRYVEVEEELQARPPVVTVMGHVDHGKTSLLDAIRTTEVAAGEMGGITQHIGAYKVELDRGTVVFLDTPGHEAFTALRARGAQATDIVILVVAADDGVMPQTVEAINHAKDAGVPIVVAVNKIDKQGANPDRVKQGLAEYALIPEEWGGETLFQEVSAKEHVGIEELLETVLLQAELLELRGNPGAPAAGIVIESRLDIGRGPVATVLVRRGTLRPGATVVAGGNWGRIRAMTDERGRKVVEAPPSTPVEITGLDGVPDAGATLYVVNDEKSARTISEHISEQHRQKELAKSAAAPADLESLTELLEHGKVKELKLIVKADVQGSQEAVVQALSKLSDEEVTVKIVHSAVGGITESDVNLAASSTGGAVIIGFNVRPETRAMQAAEQLGVQVRTFGVIYEAVDAVKQLVTGMLEPVFEEVYQGRAEVRDTFGIPRVGTVAGCYVIDGNIRRGSRARVVRDSRVVYESSINSLRRFKEDVREVKHGFECGIMVENFNDIKLGDVIEAFEVVEVRPTL